ncbi:hypothetical protein CMV_002087, partial [Castanea mollissima]
WSALSRWVHCSKYEITGLAFSSIDSDHIYIQGVDYEVFCGQWKENKKVFSYRGDSNWLGFCKSPKRDVLGGWCDSVIRSSQFFYTCQCYLGPTSCLQAVTCDPKQTYLSSFSTTQRV